jgi:hypothetical protein
MKVPGLLFLLGWLLVGVRSYLGGLKVMHDHPRILLSLVVLALVCWVVAAIWGAVRGPGAVRWAVALWLCSVAMLFAFIVIGAPDTGGPGPRPHQTVAMGAYVLSGVFFVMAVVQGIRATIAELRSSRAAAA